MSSITARRERKVVTVLFVDLVGFTARAEELDPEDVEAILRPYHERLRGELERFGGTVEKFIGDAVMALFGAPVAHEDDPERAVRAALAIRDWAREEEGAQVRIAVNTGEALINLGARPESGEGMAAGDVVNTTARLQAAAPVNGLLVGEVTYRATRHAIDYREAEPVEAKGKAELVTVWEAVDARARVARESVSTRAKLVGRERELALLREMLVRVRDDLAPQLVTLVGVPGIGKSRLVYELMQIVEQGGVLTDWRQGRALPYGEGVTFWALREIVKAQAGILETDDEEEARRKLSEAVANVISDSTDAEWVEKHLRPLAGLEAEPQTGGDRRGEAFAAWRRLLEAMAEQRPLVLVFEDLHWADDGMLDFIDHLVDWATGVPILIVCTARPELLERRPGWGGGKLNATTLSLPPLSEEETARLLGALFEQPLLDAALQHALLSRAGGNPLYAEQYAAMALERGETENLPVPETLHGVIAARLDRLPAEEKGLLQDAAVLGKVFWLGGLVDGRSRSDVEQRLHALGRKGFVQRARRTSVVGEAEYSFLHLVVRDVAYGQIPRGDRAQKHYRAAEWIESLGRRDDHAEMLAYHYVSSLELARAAGRDTGAVEQRACIALRDAGQSARALNAYSAAEHFYEEALALWPQEETETRADLLFRRALAAYGTGRDGRADAIEEARAALIAAGDPDRAAETEALLAADSWMRGRRGPGLEHLRRAEALVTGRASSAGKARVLGEVARYHMLGGHDDAAIASGREALEIATALELGDVQADVLVTVGTARADAGDLDGGVDDLERALVIAEQTGSLWGRGRAYNNLAVVFAQAFGDHARSIELHQEGLRQAERIGDSAQVRWFRGQSAYDAYWTGRFDDVWRGVSDLIAESEGGLEHYEAAGGYSLRSRVRLARDDAAGALDDAERAIDLARAIGEPQVVQPTLAAVAFVMLAVGRRVDAGAVIDEVVASLQRVIAMSSHTTLPALAEVLCDLDRAGEFAACVAASKIESPWLRASAAYAAGDFERAAELFASISVPDEAYSRLRAAQALAADGRRAEANVQLRRSLAFWRSVGASRYVRDGEALLAASA